MEFNRRTALAISTVGAATAGLSSLGVSSAGEAVAALVGPATETMLLTGCDADHTVDWDFQVTAGRRAGEWSRIPTPSNWECLAEAAGVLDPITVLHCALGHVEWLGTSELARTQAEHYGVRYEQRHREQGLLLDQVRRPGRWPSASARYCTSDQKRGPARKLITQLVTELGDLGRPARVLNCMGLRAEESRARLKKARLSRDEAASSPD